MSADNQTFVTTCPHCSKNLRMSLANAGKMGRCPGCREVFRIPEASQPSPAAPQLAPLGSNPLFDNFTGSTANAAANPFNDDYRLAPSNTPAYSPAPYSPPPAPAQRTFVTAAPRSQAGGVAWGTVGGGVGMMVLAVAWFVGGLAFGYIFFYPPILFIIGLVAAIRGLAGASSE